MQLQALIEGYRPAVTAEMEAVLGDRSLPLFAMIRYHLGWTDAEGGPAKGGGGKLLRSALCLLTCEAAGGDPERALPAAAALELLHNFTLVHDDIQDGSPQRRGRPTVWSLWGVPQAINVGDGLFGLAHLSLSCLADRGVPTAHILEAMRLLSETVLRLCAGQYLDLEFERRSEVSLSEYLAMVEGKTAALFSAAIEIGALVGGADERMRTALRRFGAELGTLFQMQDDLLGIWGSEEVTGKPVGSDILQRKKGLPLVCALEGGDPSPRQQLLALYASPEQTQETVEAVLGLLATLGARQRSEALIREQRERALAALHQVPLKAPWVERIGQVVQTLMERAF